MSLKPTEPIRDEHENVNGSPEKRIGDDTRLGSLIHAWQEERQVVAGDEEGEEEEEEGEEQGEGGKGQKNTLTHLLLGKTNGATTETAAEYEEEEDVEEGDYDDDDDDDDNDDEYIDDEDETEPRPPKKRSIDEVDEVTDKEVSQGSKKIKAWKSKQVLYLPTYKIQLKQPPSWQIECPSSTM